MNHKFRFVFLLIVIVLLVGLYVMSKNQEESEEGENIIEQETVLDINEEGMEAKADNIENAEDTLPVYTYKDLSFSYPATWMIKDARPSNLLAVFYEEDELVAELTCPIPETGFEAWNFEQFERNFEKDGRTYGTELWAGRPLPTEGDFPAKFLIFMHRNTWSNWSGENDADHSYACMLDLKTNLATDFDQMTEQAKEIWTSVE